MSTRTLIAHTSLTALCIAAFATGCGSDRSTGGTKIIPRPDSGMVNTPDTGVVNTPDAGQTGCGANPNGCAPRELIGSEMQGCMCLNVCETGYTYNAQTMMCDLVGGNPDGGMGPDAGMTGPECAVDTDCAAPNDVCLDVPQMGAVARCAGQQTCQCFNDCDPYIEDANSGCSAGVEGCFWLGAMGVVPGVCVPLTPGAGTHNQACQAMFDPGGMITGDTCERALNNFCVGVSPMDPNGTCARLCDDVNPGTTCQSLGTFTCDPLDMAGDNIGLCFNVQAFTDLGTSCTVPGDCQSGVCSPILGNSCTAGCEGLNTCPNNSVCLNGGNEGAICAQQCTFGTDTTCSNLNPNTICERIGMFNDGTPVDVCIPRCAVDADCGMAGTCNVATGHCM